MKIALNLTMTDTTISGVIPRDFKLACLGAVLENSICWLLGHGISNWQCQRQSINKKDCLLQLSGLSDSKPFLFSGVANFRSLYNEGYVPKSLNNPWSGGNSPLNIARNLTGQYRLSGVTFGNDNETILGIPKIEPNCTLANYAFGIGDCIVGLFYKGASEVRHQFSMDLAQTWSNLGMDENELRQFADTRVPNYDPNVEVGKLPLHVDPLHN
jgi:hypothetical protein